MEIEWVASFQEWLKDNQARLERENIRVNQLGVTSYRPSSIHVDFFAGRSEVTVQLWDDGQSDFHFLDWEAAERDPEAGVVVTHYELRSLAELTAKLDSLIERLSSEQLTDTVPTSGPVYSAV